MSLKNNATSFHTPNVYGVAFINRLDYNTRDRKCYKCLNEFNKRKEFYNMFKFTTDTQQIKYEVLKSVAKYAHEGTLVESKEMIPFEIIKGIKPRFRCCVYREREIIRQRIRLSMGNKPHGLNSSYDKKQQIVYVIPSACEGCTINRYQVTANCQKCLAKKCHEACKFGAVTITPTGAVIDQEKCKECGLCAKVCPYNAITDLIRPCKKSCPVDAIQMDENKIAAIDADLCINCGACIDGCPFGAVSELSQVVDVVELLKNHKNTYAVFAPAIEGQFGSDVTNSMIKKALRKLGFKDVHEVALGADAISMNEADELIEAVHHNHKLTTSCCPSFYNLIYKHFPKNTQYISHTATPMLAIARYIKAHDENAKVVFIGPCVAKKGEMAQQNITDGVDYVITFEELVALLDAREIDFEPCTEEEREGSFYGSKFAEYGGVAASVLKAATEKDSTFTATAQKCSGGAECRKALALLNAGKFPDDILEGMACEGGCINGPATLIPVSVAKRNREKLIDKHINNISQNVSKYDFSNVNLNKH